MYNCNFRVKFDYMSDSQDFHYETLMVKVNFHFSSFILDFAYFIIPNQYFIEQLGTVRNTRKYKILLS